MKLVPRLLKELLKRRTIVICGYLLATDRAAAFRRLVGRIESDSGMTHASLSVEESQSYITEVFDDYKRYSLVEKFHGTAAEVGPGDNCGVALLFLADGCEQLDLVDRFYSLRESSRQAAIYQRLLETRPELEQLCKHKPPTNENAFRGVTRYYGEAASAERFFSTPTRYDFIFSRSTLEHVSDVSSALTSMTKALRSGGMLLHKVDLRDHEMFSKSFHELKFLEIPDWLYRLMSRASGRPNRVRVDQYREVLKEKLSFTLFVTRLVGVGDIVPHRLYDQIPEELRQRSLAYVRSVKSRFAGRFRSISDEDLSIGGFFLVAKKL